MRDRENCILPDRETRRGGWEPEEEFIDRLYGIYRENLVDSPITFMALPVVVRDKETGKFYEAFCQACDNHKLPAV